MKILSSGQIRTADSYTISHEPISSIDLMERAVECFTRKLIEYINPVNKILIICGPGNNGGDGLGIARLLHLQKWDVSVFLVGGNQKYSIDNITNQERLKEMGFQLKLITSLSDLPEISHNTVIIDALFGSGITKPLSGIFQELVFYLNSLPNKKFAVDIPSGLFADIPTSGNVLKADFTFTFQTPKLSFFFPETNYFVGEWKVLDIQLHPEILQKTDTPHFTTDQIFVSEKIKSRNRFSHKGTYGHVLAIVGSRGKMGAAVLTSKAALKSGCGLVTGFIPNCGYNILQTAVPEVMVIPDQREEFVSTKPEQIQSYTTLAIGPGIGTHQETSTLLAEVLKNFNKSVVLDADALNILSENQSLLNTIPALSILTPHPKEFERLAGKSDNSFERLEKLKAFSKKYKVITVLKDAYTAICNEEGIVYFNTTGNPGMATGGSGDVLTGIIAGLLAQGYESFDAAIVGCFLHGRAGDLALKNESQESLIAGDLISYLGKAFQSVKKES